MNSILSHPPCTRFDLHDNSNTTVPRARSIVIFAIAGTLVLGVCFAQSRFGRQYWGGDVSPFIHTEGGELVNEDTVRTARETAPHSIDLPAWTNSLGLEKDVFTFTRIIFKSQGGPSPLGWINDYPDADLNLSARLQEFSTIRTDPDCRVLKLRSADLADYPFIFMSHPERMELSEEEITALRDYLLNGGALLVDDFWGDPSWAHFEEVMKRVLTGRSWTELSMEHPLFHSVFNLTGPMGKLQVPTIHLWRRGYDPDNPQSFPSFFRGRGSQQMHVRAWFDRKDRIMVLALHNSDTGDGWEREGEDETYFHQFSETRAYPLAVNAIFYLMTH